jgi:hypothetical protein
MRSQAADLDMNRMRQRRARHRGAGAYDLAERGILRDFPADRNVVRWHPAIGRLRFWGKPGPEDEPVRPRIPGGDPERERIARIGRLGEQAGRIDPAQERKRKACLDETAAIDLGHGEKLPDGRSQGRTGRRSAAHAAMCREDGPAVRNPTHKSDRTRLAIVRCADRADRDCRRTIRNLDLIGGLHCL